MPSSARLNEEFAIKNCVTINDKAPGYPVIEVTNAHASACIALHGAQVVEYQPRGCEPVLWVSKDAVYAEGKSIRGGIPICWPWFGDHPDTGMSSHGFVRKRFWQLKSTEQLDTGATQVTLFTHDDAQSHALWPHDFTLELVVTVGSTLSLALTMTNPAHDSVHISAALHSYFNVGAIGETRVHGLEGLDYLDKLQAYARRIQTGPVKFSGEVDRIYQKATRNEWIEDQNLRRNIVLRKAGSYSTVVWNPWIDKSATMDDFEPGGFRNMVCVETGVIGEDAVILASGQSHTVGVDIAVKSG